MTLRAYLRQGGTTGADLARQVGVSRALISKIASGAARPSLENALKIEGATGGAVSADELRAGAVPHGPTRGRKTTRRKTTSKPRR